MSFRNRLTFFFVVIVIVPMIAVAVVLFRLISDNETGKSDAGVAARAQTALRLYAQEAQSPAGADAAAAIARDGVLGSALAAGATTRARQRADQLARRGGVARIAVLRGGATLFDVGDRTAIAPVVRDLLGPHGRSLGRLEVSLTRADAYARLVRTTANLQVVVHQDASLLATTLPGLSLKRLPATQHVVELSVAGSRYRVVTLSAEGFDGRSVEISVLSNFEHTASNITGSRLLAGGFIVVFFITAFAFAVLVSRSLQLQIEGFLKAARSLGGGDFSAHVPIAGHDEFAALGEEFNKMSHQLEERLQQLGEQQGRLEGSLRRIGETFAVNLDRDGLLQIVLRTAVEGVGAHGGRASVRGTGERFEARAVSGDGPGGERALDAVEAAVLEAGAPRDIQLDGVSALGHPLSPAAEGSRVLGLLSVHRADRPFNESERDLFHYLAGQAAVSIENVELHERVQHQAVTDELTGLYNHRRFQEAMVTEIERARRFEQSLGLVMLDIDDFKGINDSYGHQQGDQVLREVARIVSDYSREIDAPARYGGEELALVLPGTDIDGAYNLAERIRTGIARLRLPLLRGPGTIKVTASFGVASVIPGADSDPRHLIAAADAALYEAKRAGKNKTARAQ
jgi:diguanylate cyclase (GGDEF)-like protein